MQRVSCIYTQYIFTLCLRILYLMWIYMLNALLFLLCPKASISSSQTRIFHFLSTMISFMALAGRELIFAIEAHLMLHFGFLIKTVVLVIAEQCSQSQGLSAPPAVLPAKGWGCTSSWEGTQPGLLTWCYAQQQLRVQKKEGGTFRAMAFVFPSNPVWGALLSWKCCLPTGRSKLFPCFSSLAYTAFAFPSKVPLSQLRSPHIFRFSSLYHLKRVSKWLLGAELLPGLNHNNQTDITAILWTVCINTPSQFVLKIKKSPPTPASYQPYVHECKTVV